jgi:hypothetical protein
MNSSENVFVKASDLLQSLPRLGDLKENPSFDGYEHLDIITPFLMCAGIADAAGHCQRNAKPVHSPSTFKLKLKPKASLSSLNVTKEKTRKLKWAPLFGAKT